MKSDINNLIKLLEDEKRFQKKCKHARTKTIKNAGDYKIKVFCMDCQKILKVKFKY